MDKKTVDETEYDFEHTDNNISAFGDASAKNQLLEKLKGKTVYLAFGIIIIVLIMYKLLGALFATGASKIEPKAPIAPAQSIKSSYNDEFNRKLAIIENKGLEDKLRINESLRNVNALATKVANLQSQVDLINNRLVALTAQLQQQNALKKKAPKAKSVVKQVQRPVYYVQALVPERAWLKQSDGTMITVTRGDKLPGYGQVSAINLAEGVVMTTEGDMIGFHPAER